MRGHIRVRSGPTGTAYELRVFAGTDETGKRRYLVETFRGSRRDAEKRLAQLVAGIDTGQSGWSAGFGSRSSSTSGGPPRPVT